PAGETTSQLNAPACTPEACAIGTVDEGDGNCVDCSAGQYCAGGQSEAVTCDGDEWDDDADATTACVPKQVCTSGYYVESAGDPTHDRTCASCAEGTFSTEEN